MKKSRLLLAGGALVVFFIIVYMVSSGGEPAVDTAVREWFYLLRSDGLNSIVIFLTHIGDTKSIIALCVILLILPWTRMKYGIPVSIAASAASSLNHFLKTVFMRQRPDEAMFLIEQGGWSFPSGHSITSMVVFGLLIWLVRRNVENKKTANVITAVLCIPWLGIGLSRIYIGVHYPTDVFGGWMLGVVILMISILIIEKVKDR